MNSKNMNYLVWLLIGIMYAPIFYKLYSGGTNWSDDYSHAYFILPISLWLVWRKRALIKEYAQKLAEKPDSKAFSIFSFLLILIGAMIFFFGWRMDYDMITIFSLIPLLFGLISFLYGKNTLKTLLFPLLYLLFLVPPPAVILDTITMPMRYNTSVVTEKILAFVGYPITRDGLLLTIGYNEIFMGAPCSGFRSLITMFALVLVYVYLNKGTISRKLILTAFITPFALLGNIIRVITLCLITFYFGEEAGQGFFHGFSGVVVFIVTILGIIGLESLLESRATR